MRGSPAAIFFANLVFCIAHTSIVLPFLLMVFSISLLVKVTADEGAPNRHCKNTYQTTHYYNEPADTCYFQTIHS